MGGTNFLGPAFVNAALEASHNVTLFNRGITNPNLFPQLEKIRRVRSEKMEEQDLSGLTRGSWDAIIDVWPHDPTIVEEAAQLLGSRTSHYLYVSSVAAYGVYPRSGMDETAPLAEWSSSQRG